MQMNTSLSVGTFKILLLFSADMNSIQIINFSN